MPNKIKQGAYEAVLTSYLTTELNALANGAYSAAGTAFDNGASGVHHQFGDFELNVTYGTAPSAGGYCALYLVPAIDGANYADGGGSVAPPANGWVGNFDLRAVTTAQKRPLLRVPLPNTLFKPVLLNSAGQAMGATGHTLGARFYSEEIQ